MRILDLRAFAVRLFAGLLLCGLIAAAGAQAASAGVTCTTYNGIPVALAAGEPASYSLTGELCATPGELEGGKTVQLLIHGATYNHTYWDFGTIDRVSYSYARDVAAAGFPTFAIDEIGAGASSHPLSTDVSIQTAGFVAHEIVQDLLHGSIGGIAFGKVIAVGHSFGSITTWEEEATYHDIAGAIITGGAHSNTVFANGAIGDLYPAIDDPRFANSGLDSGYLTSVPGARAGLFYNIPDSDPNVIAADEASKDVISVTEFVTGLALEGTTVTLGINVPVLVILGSKDAINCGAQVNGGNYDCSSGTAIAQQESPFYSAQAQLRACSIPASGHDISLALNHDLQEIDATVWAYEYVGQPAVRTDIRTLPPGCNN